MRRFGWLVGLGMAIALALAFNLGNMTGSLRSYAQSEEATIDTTPFEIALMGDMPYSEEEEAEFLEVMEQVNNSEAAFAVHVGDIKGGQTPCTDEAILQRKELFEQFEKPFVLLLGDNEWTDCHREGAGGFDPLERLEFLRETFTQGDRSLAVPAIELERQSLDPQFANYRENVRWTYHNVMFASMHVVGSSNNVEQNAAEYEARNAANLAWMAETFELARSQEMAGIMLFIHANPNFEELPGTPLRAGFDDFIAALYQEVTNFERPVALVHGDTHQFQRNNPLLLAVNAPDFDISQLDDEITVDPETGDLIMSDELRERLDARTRLDEVGWFTRLEVFGSPTIAWVRAIVEPETSYVFDFKMEFGEYPRP